MTEATIMSLNCHTLQPFHTSTIPYIDTSTPQIVLIFTLPDTLVPRGQRLPHIRIRGPFVGCTVRREGNELGN